VFWALFGRLLCRSIATENADRKRRPKTPTENAGFQRPAERRHADG
jgi:hypothetical protein